MYQRYPLRKTQFQFHSRQIAVQADVRERIVQLGLEASLNSPEEFAVVIKSDTDKWARVIRAANIKVE
jgi:tripartite-type tricarboxylate transporter receptor subunit TctC